MKYFSVGKLHNKLQITSRIVQELENSGVNLAIVFSLLKARKNKDSSSNLPFKHAPVLPDSVSQTSIQMQ